PASAAFSLPSPPFASLTQPKPASAAAAAAAAALGSDHVAKTLAGTAVYTVSNSNNEFVLISDPDGAKSIGLLCFRKEDAESFLAQVRLRRRELRSGAKVVPITLDQVYMLKVEGIAFRFLPDPVQIKNALEVS
ncbi:protein TIC 22, chloroplastic-like, partial [Morus notabilis]|uniref:protein TIC 22, chloroplastic-like n=1 Tax=Morus notabilis TaxID=981085 RepID=UPI000CED0B21